MHTHANILLERSLRAGVFDTNIQQPLSTHDYVQSEMNVLVRLLETVIFSLYFT